MGERAWASDRQGVEAPWPLVLVQKDTQREIKLQKTPRDGAEHREDEADVHGMADIRAWRKSLKIDRGMGFRSRPEGGGEDMRLTESGRGSKRPLHPWG